MCFVRLYCRLQCTGQNLILRRMRKVFELIFFNICGIFQLRVGWFIKPNKIFITDSTYMLCLFLVYYVHSNTLPYIVFLLFPILSSLNISLYKEMICLKYTRCVSFFIEKLVFVPNFQIGVLGIIHLTILSSNSPPSSIYNYTSLSLQSFSVWESCSLMLFKIQHAAAVII